MSLQPPPAAEAPDALRPATSHRPRRGDGGQGAAGRRRRNARALALAAALTAAGLVLTAASVLQPPAGRIVSGVRAGGVALGGLTPDEAAAALAAIAPGADVSVTLVDDAEDRSWTRRAGEVGLLADPASLAERAYGIGREGGWLSRRLAVWRARFGAGVTLPVGAFDAEQARRALEALAAEFVQAPQAAELRIGPDGALQERAAVSGRTLDIDGSLAALAEAARVGGRSITLVSGRTMPRVFDVAAVTEAYKLITSAPVTLRWRDGQSWTASTADLAKWARVEDRPNAAGDAVPTIVLDTAAVTAWLAPIAPVVASAPQPARFGVASSRIVLRQAAEQGYSLDVPGTIERLIEAAYSDGRTNEVAVTVVAPDSLDSALTALAASVPLVSAATSVAGMPDGMLTNVRRAAEQLDGLAIAPNATFSLLEHLGPITPEGGFQMLFIDPLGPVENGVGGGISQAATTLFRLALRAGLPIVERHAHPYRIGWVEPPVGLDATVGPPDRDLRFVNDTGDPVLLLARIDPVRQALFMTLYGVGTPRAVRLTEPVIRDLTPVLPPVERGASGLPAGARAQIGWAREGATVTVERIVDTPDGERREAFESRYAPAGDVFVVPRD